jgi:tetratricopeptide (TPR) repeat protein
VRHLIRRYDYAAALRALAVASPETEDVCDLHYYRGYTLAELKRYDEALDAYRSALALRPQAIEFRFYTANCLRLMKKPEEALREYDLAVAARAATGLPSLPQVELSARARAPRARRSPRWRSCCRNSRGATTSPSTWPTACVRWAGMGSDRGHRARDRRRSGQPAVPGTTSRSR